MGRILETIERFFKQDGWPYSLMEDRPILRTGFNGSNGQWICYAQERDEQQQFVFYSVFPVKAPPEKRAAVVEFITRVNYGMIIGNFELDYSDGEIRYKTSLDVENEILTAGLVHHILYANVYTMDRYFPGLMKVIYTDVLPQDAVKQIEG